MDTARTLAITDDPHQKDAYTCHSWSATGHRLPAKPVGGWAVFPGEHHAALFQIADRDRHIDFAMESEDGAGFVKVTGFEVVGILVL